MGDRGAQPARPAEHPRDLGNGAGHVIDVVQARVRHGEIKGLIPEWKRERIGETAGAAPS
jgi:hypothetical protein